MSTLITRVTLRRDTIETPECYPFSVPALSQLDSLEMHPAVTFFIGENGSGKSTLLEAIAVSMRMNAEGGSQHFNFSTRASHSSLSKHLRVAKGIKLPRSKYFLRAESFFNVATELENIGDSDDTHGQRLLHEQSHGESFMSLFSNRFYPGGLYLLDEPEAAMSTSGLLRMLALLHDKVREKSQFIIVTHSPILLAYPNATIYQFSEQGIERVAYEETEHYQLTRAFLNNPQRMLSELLT